MKKQTLFKKASFILTALVLCSVFTVSSSIAADKVYKWKIQSAYPHGDLSFELMKGFTKEVEEMSNGRLKISLFAEGEIVGVEQLLQATQMKMMDGLHAMGAFWGGIVPVGEIEFGLPHAFAFDNTSFEDAAADLRKFYFENGFVDLLRQEYDKQGLYWLDMHTYGETCVFSTKPLETYEDWKGLKIRDEGIYNQFHNMIGARGTSVSPGETYLALKLGTLDATHWDISAISGLKWHEVAPYWVQLNDNKHLVGHILLNKDSWNALPDDLKKVVQKGAENYWHATVKGYEEEFANAKQMVKDGQLKESYLTPETIQKHKEIAYKIWDEVAKRDEASAKAIQLLKEWKGIK